MPEEMIRKKEQEKEQDGIERMLLLFCFLCSIVVTVVTIEGGWPLWLALFTDAGWLLGFALHCAKARTYAFRAYVMTCLIQMCVVLWSVSTATLDMTMPVLSMLAVVLVIYGIRELLCITAVVTAFLTIYHLFIQQTVNFSSGNKMLQTVLEIISVFLIEYIMYFLIKKRQEGNEKQQRAIVSLKQAERSKDDFMANVSHEIRTPINTICGMSEIILREELSSQVHADVSSIQTAGRNLQSIVSDVLDFTEMQSGKMALAEEVYNITSTINDVINMTMARKGDSMIDFIVDCDADLPSTLIGDEQKIRRVIMNLINNALKFTVEGCVSLFVSSRKTEYGVNLIVRIKDTGIGMKKESMEKLFTSFNQVDTKRNRQKEGIGLGLAIVQTMIDMMGGFITVSSELYKGTEIQFVVPQRIADTEPIATVNNRQDVNVAVYVDLERYDRPEVREAYSRVISRMISQLMVKCHVCQNLAELKRRTERETFTHVFVSIEEYEEGKEYFDEMVRTTKVVVIMEHFHDDKVTNPAIYRLYKPFYVLPIAMVLNDENIVQSVGERYSHKGRFIAPDAHVLIVDDNLMNLRVLSGLLEPYKIKTTMATSGAEALEKIEDMGYDVILMDHMMPEMDGVETLHRIRQKQGNYFKNIPIIAVTANAVGGMREVFLREGFQDFIPKPIELSVLDRVLRRTLPQEKMLSVEVEDDSVVVKEDELELEKEIQALKKELEALQEELEGEEPATPQRFTDLPPESFNEEMGVKYCGNQNNYIEILRLTGMAGQEDKERIGQFYEAKDWKSYTTQVHALKSTMLSIGVEKLSGMAKELELAGKSGDVQYILEHHDDMMLEYERILKLLEESETLHPDI
ncbi:MAG: response regulator [Lachnospiraceae bacterium]|nr:response regulator [Lachnospiraceae bacterium]